MEEIKKTTFNSCPDNETLSAFVDGMISPDSDEAGHISSCQHCSNKIAAYKKISLKLKEELSNSVDKHFLERLKSSVRDRIEEDYKRVIPFHILLARAAIVFLAITASILYVKNLFDYKKDIQHRISAAQSSVNVKPTDSSVSKTGDIPINETAKSADNTDTKDYMEGTLALNDMRSVSTDGKSGEINFSDKSKDGKPAQIPRVVHHVWVVKNVEEASAKLSDLVKQTSTREKLVTRKIKEEKTKCAVKGIDKISLVKLVRQLSSEGYQLLTPVQPQPENSIFEGKPEDPVKYYFDLVSI